FVAGKDDAGSSNVGPKFIFNSGTITGNTATAIGTADVYYGADIAVSAGNNFVSSVDKNHTIQIGKDAVIGEGFIGISSPKGTSPYGPYGFDKAVYPIDKENHDMYIGGILLTSQDGISGTVPSTYSGYTVHSGLYVRSDRTSGDIEFKVSYPSDIQTADINNYFYLVGYQPLDASGTLTGTPEYFVPERQADGLKISIPADAAYTSGHAVVILAEPKAIPLTLTLTHDGDGTFEVDGSPGVFSFVFGIDGTLGTPIPATAALQITADSGWVLTSLMLTAADGQVTDKISLVSGDLVNVSYYELADGTNTIHAVFSQEYSVTYTGDAVDGSNGLTAVNGTDYTATLTMATGHDRPDTITVNVGGTTVTVGTEYTYDQTTGAITISGSYITDDIEINAVGVQVAAGSDGFTITATADSGSVIDPSGSVIVSSGGSIAFTFSANPGCVIVSVSVDGINDTDAIASGFYIFSDVRSNHTIAVTSEPDSDMLHIIVDIVGGEGTAEYHVGPSSAYVRLTGDQAISRNADVYVTIDVADGYRFVKWTGEVNSTEVELHFPDVTHTVRLTAHLDGTGTGAGDGGEWSPLNLIMAILALAAGVVALIGGRGRTKEGDGEHRSVVAFTLRIVSIVVGIISLIIFFLTEDWTQPVVPIDGWTLLMLILLIISAAIALISYHFDKDEEEEDGQEDGQ
ncbi:MAG: hypothetical protein LBV63_01575, partial [Candidatus Methanoplasma sp.]|nr:hypothetical protein [Candidatus Methanoplasma sp.]